MPTANERLRDYLISRQIGLARLSGRHARQMTRLLERALREASRELRLRLLRLQILGHDRGPFVTLQIRQTIRTLEALLAESYREIGGQLEQRLLDLAVAEVEMTRAAMRRAIPAGIAVEWSFPGEALLRAIVTRNPMQSGPLGAYFAKTTGQSLVKLTLRKYRDAIREAVSLGLLRAESIDRVAARIAREVRILARRHLRTVVDTATKYIAMEARQAFLQANAGEDGVVKGYQWLSTLDLRTTKEYCIPRDGRVYGLDFRPIGHSYEWGAGPGRIHWGCRSGMTAVLKSWQELGIDAEELTGLERASMDGQVPATTNLRDFLAGRKWSERELVEMFGRRRADRILAGELTVPGALRQVGVRAA